MVDAGVVASSGSVSWALIDTAGTLLSSGTAATYQVTPSAFGSTVEATALVNVPSDVPPTLQGQTYQLRWSLFLDQSNPQLVHERQSESLQVTAQSTESLGAESSIELAGDFALMHLTTALTPTNAPTASLYNGNTVLQANLPAVLAGGTAVSSGRQFSVNVNTVAVSAAIEPYSLLWSYQLNGRTHREQGKLFLVNPSILQAIDDVQSRVAKARTTLFGFEDAIFDPVTILTWLRRGRDFFNIAGGMITTFTMLNATGGVREMWLRYAEVEALRAQALAEGEKAFNYSGLQVTLEVDKAGPYNEMAEKLASELDAIVKDLKKNLKILGLSGGDGDLANAGYNPAALGYVGIGVNSISPNWGRSGRLF
jgi:hypothetical protein